MMYLENFNKDIFCSRNWQKFIICCVLVAIIVFADIDILLHERSPWRHPKSIRYTVDVLSVLTVFSCGMWLSFCQHYVAKIALLFLAAGSVLECLFAHVAEHISTSSLLLVADMLEPGSELRLGYTWVVILVLASFLVLGWKLKDTPLRGRYMDFMKRLLAFTSLGLLVLQFFVLFPLAPSAHLRLKWGGRFMPTLEYPGWGFKPGIATEYLVPQLRSMRGILGDWCSIVAFLIDPGSLPVNRADKLTPLWINKVGTPLADTIILVVGESSASQHWGLYGFHLETTPELAKLRKQITVIPQVHSAADMTRLAVLPQISLWSPDDLKGDRRFENLIEFAQDQGYKTYFLTSTSAFGQWSGDIGQIGLTAQIFRGSSADRGDDKVLGDAQLNKDYSDDEVYFMAQKVLSDPIKKKFIVIHEWGSHCPYNNFDAKDKRELPKVTKYDLTIHHTDKLLAQLITSLNRDKRSDKTLLIYASDHGEIPSTPVCGHYSLTPRGKDYLIPMILGGGNVEFYQKWWRNYASLVDGTARI